MENPTRRRVLAAGITGTALGLLGSRQVLAGTTPPSTPGSAEPSVAPTGTDPPDLPTTADIELLGFAQSLELAAADLYQTSLDGGVEDRVITLIRDNHRSYAQVIAGLLGVNAPGQRDDSLYDDLAGAFGETEIRTLAATAYDLESTLVATYVELLRSLEGIDGARLIASIITVESQSCVVLADMAGNGEDLDVLFVNEAEPLTPSTSGG